MLPRTHTDDSFAPIPDPLGDSGPVRSYATGLTGLDAVTAGGVRPGDLWVLTGRPGQGRSMLLTQLAGQLAIAHGLSTYLVSNRDPARVIAARLLAHRTRIPLSHITEQRLTDRDRERLAASTRELRAAPLRVLDGPYARHRALDQLRTPPQAPPFVVVFDDPDWEVEWDLREARQLADQGAAVIIALPRERVLLDDGGAHTLDPAVGLADLVVEIRHDDLSAHRGRTPELEPGRAVLAVARSRRGPTYDIAVGFFAHLASFFELE